MLTYFPNLISRKSMTYYFITLAVVSVLFISRILPFVWILFGAAEVCLFFYFSNDLTKRWRTLYPKAFVKKLFWTALAIRLVYMIFAYFFYDIMTGQPFTFHTADEQVYYKVSLIWSKEGFEAFRNEMKWIDLSDSGEMYLTALACKIFGPYVLTARVLHSLASALTCVLIYRIAQRHFGESTARMAAIFCMLMPNLVYYCGLHLKEADMVFFTVLLIDCVDKLLLDRKFDWACFVMALVSAFAMFTFRTPLGAVGLMAVFVAIVMTRGRLGNWWKRGLMIMAVVIGLSATTIGDRILREVGDVWDGREENQRVGMEWRSLRVGGNEFARYASKSVFAPLIFTIPFPTMVNTEGQENQQMIHGGNYVKNIMSGFTIFALVMLLLNGEWRKHTLPMAMMVGYLAVIALSNFAQSERFHQPALPFELMFAAYGISQLKKKHVRWIDYWMLAIMVANIGWAWFKLAGRGMT
jgi:hypothetical protein